MDDITLLPAMVTGFGDSSFCSLTEQAFAGQCLVPLLFCLTFKQAGSSYIGSTTKFILGSVLHHDHCGHPTLPSFWGLF